MLPALSRPISFLFEERNGSWTPKKVDQRKSPLDSSPKWGVQEQNQGRRYLSGAWPGCAAFLSSAMLYF